MKKLNVFLVLSGRASVVNGSNIWTKNFYDTLLELGHDVTLLNIDEFVSKHTFSSSPKEFLSNELPKEFKKQNDKKKFNLFFSYLHNGQVLPQAFTEIKKTGVFIVNYTTNYHQFPMYADIAKIADISIHATKIAKQGFDSVGAQSYYMPFAANPKYYKPINKKEKNAVFIGSPYGGRPYHFWRALQHGIDIQLWGPKWKIPEFSPKEYARNLFYTYKTIFSSTENRLAWMDTLSNYIIRKKLNENYPKNIHESLSDDEYVIKLASSAISVNFNESRCNVDFLDHRVILGCNLRDFENTMSGTLSLTQYSDELPDFFEDGKEVVSFKNEYELVDKLKYYLAHNTEREKIAQAGYQKASREHTWQKRFEVFFDSIKIN